MSIIATNDIKMGVPFTLQDNNQQKPKTFEDDA